jgi:Na+-translocating ferredoxin:NAD+ oxidoreductase subunit B
MPAFADRSLADRIDALLPQTQCRRCGYDGCRPYADAIAAGVAPINRCPPAGDATIATLAALLDTPALALDPACGPAQPFAIARIDENACIGCALCIKVCPVDAIVGAPKVMHTVLAAHCTGCELCLPPCPVDCITMLPASHAWSAEDADRARARHARRDARRGPGVAPGERAPSARTTRTTAEARRAAVAAALARARARRASGGREDR